ncbi:MAG: hypothetical protein JWO63_2321 [Frankiales bacterium]|nr:hypothetical protein [Frankiales bacterium]
MTDRLTARQIARRTAFDLGSLVPPLGRLRSQRDELAASLAAQRADTARLQSALDSATSELAAATASPAAPPAPSDHVESAPMAFPPGHFYSPVADLTEISQRQEQIFAVPDSLPGIDLNAAGQLDRLTEFAAFAAEQPFADGPTEGLRYQFVNNFFSYGDGMAYYCMLRSIRPRRIIEVGSGWSSALALDVDELFFDASTEMTFIEPYPDRLAELIRPEDRGRVRILEEPLHAVDPSLFSELAAGDLLFIDSTHVSKIGSDVNQLILDVLPSLPAGVHIHVHDVFYPFEYPRDWVYDGRSWSEDYLLRAYLSQNERVRITWFNSYLNQFHHGAVSAAMPLWARNTGGSIYLETV